MPDDFHADFAAAIRSGNYSAIEPWLSRPAALRHMAVYRNNVVLGVIAALRAAYPAVERLVGPGFFATMAKAYWQEYPSMQASMSLYGADLARFIAGYPPSAKLVYLADVARLDRAWLEAHHAADRPALGPADIAGLVPDQLAQLAPGLHPSVRLWSSTWPAYQIWCSNREAAAPARLVLRPEASFALVWRHRGVVRHRALTAADYAFFAELTRGASLQDAGAAALAQDAGHDAAALFGEALGRAIFNGEPS